MISASKQHHAYNIPGIAMLRRGHFPMLCSMSLIQQRSRMCVACGFEAKEQYIARGCFETEIHVSLPDMTAHVGAEHRWRMLLVSAIHIPPCSTEVDEGDTSFDDDDDGDNNNNDDAFNVDFDGADTKVDGDDDVNVEVGVGLDMVDVERRAEDANADTDGEFSSVVASSDGDDDVEVQLLVNANA
jgi:hypothetical protein